MTTLTITPGALALGDLRRLYRDRPVLGLDPAAREAIADSAATVARVIASGQVVYGVNTGFGKLAQKTIPVDRLADLQKALVRSHCAGVGDPLADDVVFLAGGAVQETGGALRFFSQPQSQAARAYLDGRLLT